MNTVNAVAGMLDEKGMAENFIQDFASMLSLEGRVMSGKLKKIYLEFLNGKGLRERLDESGLNLDDPIAFRRVANSAEHPIRNGMIRVGSFMRANDLGYTSVRMWYDRKSRNWVVQRKDNGDQIGDAFFVHSKKEAIKIKEELELLIL